MGCPFPYGPALHPLSLLCSVKEEGILAPYWASQPSGAAGPQRRRVGVFLALSPVGRSSPGAFRRHEIGVARSHLRSSEMALEKQLLDSEKKLWTNDAVFYENNLIEESLLVFPETGVITRSVAVDAILTENAEGRRWAEVQFDEVRSLRLADDAALLTYRAAARWEHEESKSSALASSVYVKRDGVWKLAFHQQTPIEGG